MANEYIKALQRRQTTQPPEETTPVPQETVPAPSASSAYIQALQRIKEQQITDGPKTLGDKVNQSRVTTTPEERLAQLTEMRNQQAERQKAEAAKPSGQEVLGESIYRAIGSASHGLYRTADFLLPEEVLGEDNPVSKFFDYEKRINDSQEQAYQQMLGQADPSLQIAGGLTRGVTEAAPQAALALFTGGGSAVGQGAALGGQAASTGAKVIGNMLKNPSFWSSVATTLGTTYDEAKEAGATEFEATATAMLYSLGGAAIEVGGGIETLPSTTPGLLQWVRSSGEEALEEVLQGGLEHVTKWAFYDHEKEWFSLTDPEAIISFDRMAQEAIGGFTVGGILGGGMTGIQAATNYLAQQQQYKTLGEFFLHQSGGDMSDAVARIMQSTVPGTDAHTAAQEMLAELQQGGDISLSSFGRLMTESRSEETVAARQRYDGVLASAQQTGVATEVAEPVARVTARFGRVIQFVPQEQLAAQNSHLSEMPLGQYTADGRVLINSALSSEQAVDFVLKHELTHSIEGTAGWNTLVRTVRRSMGEAAWTQTVEQERNRRRTLNDPEGAAHPEREVIANWIGKHLYTGGLAQAIQGNKKTASAVVRTLDRLRLALGRSGKNFKAGQIAALERTFLKTLESGQTVSGDSEGQYVIAYTDQNIPVVVIKQDILAGVAETDYVDHVKNVIKNRFSVIPIAGRLVKVNLTTRDEYTNSKNTQYYRTKDNAIYEDKLRAGGYLDEIVLASTNYVNEDLLHQRKDNFVQFARGDVLMQIDGRDYSAKVIIGFTSGNSMVLYDVIGFSPTNFTVKRKTGNAFAAQSPDAKSSSNISDSNTTIAENAPGVNTQYTQNGPKNAQNAFLPEEFAGVKEHRPKARKSDPSESTQEEGRNAPVADVFDPTDELQPLNPEAQSGWGKNADVHAPEHLRREAPELDTYDESAVRSQMQTEAPRASDADEYDEAAMEALVEEKKLTRRQQANMDSIREINRLYDEGAIDAEERDRRLRGVADAEGQAVAKDFGSGRRGTAEQKAAAKRVNAAQRAEQAAKKERLRGQELRREVATLEGKLTSMLQNPTKQRHIPTDMAEGVAELLGMLKEDPAGVEQDIQDIRLQMAQANDPNDILRLEKALNQKKRKLRKLAEALSKLETAYKNYGEASHHPNIYDERFAQRITALRETMGDKTVRELDAASLQQVAAILRGVLHQVDTANRLFSAALREDVDEVGQGIIREVNAEARVWPFRRMQWLMQWQLSPERFFAMLGGWKKGSFCEQLGRAMTEAQTRVLEIKRDWGEHFRELANHKDYDRLGRHGKDDLVDIGLADSKGEPMRVTRGMMVSLYEMLCCEGNRTAIIDGGLRVPDVSLYYKGDYKNAFAQGQSLLPGVISEDLHRVMHRMNATDDVGEMQALQKEYTALLALANQDLDAIKKKIEGMMTDYERQLHQTCREWFDRKSKTYINEATEKVWGYQVARVKAYYPVHRDAGMVFTELNSLVQDSSLEGTGSLKSRVRSKAPVLLTDICQELVKSGEETAKLGGLLPFEVDFKKIYNTTNADYTDSVKKAIGHKFGAGRVVIGSTGEQYIDNLLADMAGKRQAEQGPFSVLRRNAVRATMSLNLRVAVSQLGALPTAAAELGWTYVAKAVRHLGPVSKEKFELMLANSPYLYERCRGGGGLEEFAVAKEGNNPLDKAYQWVDKKTQGNLLGWCEKVDNKTAITLWFGCEEWVKDHHPGLKPDSREFYKETGRKLDEVIRKTQSNYTSAERSDMLREKSEAFKLLTMYKTDANQSWNILYEATARLRSYQADLKAGKNGVTEADVKEAKTKLAGAYTGVIAGNVVLAVVLRTLANLLLKRNKNYRDEAGELSAASLGSAVGQEMLSNLAGMFVFGDAVYEVVAARVFGETYYGMSDMGLETVGNLLNRLATGKVDSMSTAKGLVQDLFKAFGIPAKNFIDIVNGLVYHAEDIRNGDFLSLRAGAGMKLTDAHYYRRLYTALQKGDNEKVTGLRSYLIASGKTDTEIRAGLRTVVKDSDTLYAREMKKAQKVAMESLWFPQLTDEEQDQVLAGLSSYIADLTLQELDRQELSASNRKAAEFIKKGLTPEEYFLAQVVKRALFADKDGDGQVSRQEYRQTVEESEYDAAARRLMLKLK